MTATKTNLVYEYKTVVHAKSAKAFRLHDKEINELLRDGWEVTDNQTRLTQVITRLQRSYDPATRPIEKKPFERVNDTAEQLIRKFFPGVADKLENIWHKNR